MATTAGTVDCIRVGDDFSFVGIKDATGVFEGFIVWFGPQDPSAFTRIMHSMWLLMLKEAFISRDTVIVAHDTNSAYIRSVELTK